MNKAKCNKELYCDFLIAAQNNFTCTNLADLTNGTIAHDSINRWLLNNKMTPKILWEHTQGMVDLNLGWLIADDTVLDKPFGDNIGLSQWQYSGTHHRVVHGIGLETLLWTDGEKHIPVDYRIYAKKEDGYTKNHHFRQMLSLSANRGFKPQGILIDAWYATVENLKMIDSLGWNWITELQSNRNVSLEPHKYLRVDRLDFDNNQAGIIVHLKGYGFIKVFKITAPKGRIGYFATPDQTKTSKDIQGVYALRWEIEEYHRGLKQTTGIECCQARKPRIQRNHIFCSILAFTALEQRRLKTGISWYESKRQIIDNALQRYLRKPFIPIPRISSA